MSVKRHWVIKLKHPKMWNGWRVLVRMYYVTKAQAEEEAKKAIKYYQGTTEWKVELAYDRPKSVTSD